MNKSSTWNGSEGGFITQVVLNFVYIEGGLLLWIGHEKL